MKEDVKWAAGEIAAGCSVSTAVETLLEIKAPGDSSSWWPKPNTKYGTPYPDEFWESVLVDLIGQLNRKVTSLEALIKIGHRYKIDPGVIKAFLIETHLWKKFTTGTLNRTDSSVVLRGARQGEHPWIIGTRESIKEKHKLPKRKFGDEPKVGNN